MASRTVLRPLLANGSLWLRISPSAARSFSSSKHRAIAAPEIDFSTLPPPNPRRARLVPESPSYFTQFPEHTDKFLHLQHLYRQCETLPALKPALAPRITWLTLAQYRVKVGETVTPLKFKRLLEILQKLNRVQPELMPEEVRAAIEEYRRAVDPHSIEKKTATVNDDGTATAIGRRKSSRAKVWLVEGDGQVVINGKSIVDVFGRIHDRESALWALQTTQRLDKYNVWALVAGGGTTGQAESLTLGIAKALMIHEPALKPVLRRAGVLTRDPRKVERKKPGRIKARKMPTWVKR